MERIAFHIVGEFHGLVQIIRDKGSNFTGHSGKGNAVTSAQFNSVFGLGTIEHIRVTGRIRAWDSDIIRGNPSGVDTEFYNEAFLLGRHPTAIEAETGTPVTFVNGAVVGFAHIEAMILHRSREASAELLLREESAHAQSKGKILEVVLVILDIEHTPSARSGKTERKARSLGSLFFGSLLSGFGGSDRISFGLLAGFLFGSGDRIGTGLFGGDRVSDSLLAGFLGGDRVGDGLLASGFNSGGATFGVNLLTQGVYGARIYSRSFSYRFSSGSGSRFSSRSRGRSRGNRRRSGSRSRGRCDCCGSRSRCGSRGNRRRSGSRSRGRSRCRCGRGLSIGSANHRGKEHNHCKFLHRFSIHKRVCIKITRNI